VTDLNIGLARNAPVITSLSKNQGEVGITVTITGGNFGNVQAGSSVIFYNEKKAAVSSWSDTSITCTVPAGAQSGNVVVETASGRSNGASFTVVSGPVVARVSTWYLAEGCTGGDFETWVLVQNPNAEATHVKLTFMTEKGIVPGPEMDLAGYSRYSFRANTYVTSFDVSTKVEADKPVIAERAMYGNNRAWAHDSVGYSPP
jgi:hypothetical protein